MTEAVEDVGTNALAPEPAPVVENVETAKAPETGETENLETETPEPAPVVHGNKGKTPWYMERINEETNKRIAAEEREQAKEREAAEARSLLERMQGGDKETPRARREEPENIDALVDAKAAKLLFDRDRRAVIEAGQKEFGTEAFNDIAAILGAAGAATEDFIQDVIAVDKDGAHKILDVLAKDPERARALSNMDLRRRTAELTRISDKMTEAPKPAPVPVRSGVSKVPAPKPVIEAISDNVGEMDLTNDKLDDQTWSKMWDKKYRKKA